VPNTARNPIECFAENVPYFPERNFTITGVTKDSTGAALGGCTLRLFNAASHVLAQTTISDASGNYSFVVDKTQTWYVVSYKGGAPDVAGTSVNTLAGL
jgi:hypothetical protein